MNIVDRQRIVTVAVHLCENWSHFHHGVTHTMSSQTAQDVPLNVRSEQSSSERRISPSWSLAHLKTRLEPITGIPSTSQKLVLNLGGSQSSIPLDASNEETTQLSTWPLQPYSEIYVSTCRVQLSRMKRWNYMIMHHFLVRTKATIESLTVIWLPESVHQRLTWYRQKAHTILMLALMLSDALHGLSSCSSSLPCIV